MNNSRRTILMGGAAAGAMTMSGCDPTTPPDNNTGGIGAGGAPPAGGSGATTGGNTTGGGDPAGGGSSTGGVSGGGTLPAGPRVRYDVSSPEGQARLAVYARAVGLMMALPEGDPRSWTFQWYSHWVKGPQDSSGKTAELSRVYGSAPSAARSLAQQMWSGCQAHGENQDETFFLPWHRMYVLAFENIVRAVAEEPYFTLPYWNYLDPAQRSIPAQFRRQNDPVYGALYRDTRNSAVNAGAAIASAANLSPSILAENTYSPLGADQGFCANLDFGLHGTVHVGVGNSINGMGLVPWAAGDPIFWLHHCNIDRLWASWNADGNANPSDADFTAKPFPFAGPSGAAISYTVGQMLSLSSAGYGYDVLLAENGAPEPQARISRSRGFRLPFLDVAEAATTDSAPRMRQAAFRAPPVLRTLPSVTHVAEGIQLGGAAPIRIRLVSTQATPEVAARALAPLIAPAPRLQRRAAAAPSTPTARLMALFQPKKTTLDGKSAPTPAPAPPPPPVPAPKPGQKVFLVLNDLSTDIQPGVIYQIYLEAPRKGGAPEPITIGTLNFFSAMRTMAGMKMASRARSYDITDLALQLAAQGRLESSPAVSFVPLGSPAADARPLIGSISLAIQ